MGKGRHFSADKKLTLVGQSHDEKYNEICFLVEVEDGCETRLFRMYFDLDEVVQHGTELIVKLD